MIAEALCDFVDDALCAKVPITPAHLDAMMATLKRIGITRVTWAYYADGRGGWIVPDGLVPISNGSWRDLGLTYKTLGNPLRAAVEAGHRHGIEIYAYFKPYETGAAVALPEGAPESGQYRLLDQIGGPLVWMDPFVPEHPTLRLRHRDGVNAGKSNAAIASIRLVKKDDSPTRIKAEHLKLWVSDDNYRYRPLDVPFSVRESIERSPIEVRDVHGKLFTLKDAPVRVITLSGLQIDDPFVVVATDFTDGEADFVNPGTLMMKALDSGGREIHGLFGMGLGLWYANRADYRDWGLVFDLGWGAHQLALDQPDVAGARRQGYIGFARGRNEYLSGALCETEPAVQQFWLENITEMLDAGVDGVEIRIESHSTHTDFPDEYGFNPAVLAECERRGQKPDAGAVARVRGDAYNQFLRDAKKLIATRGKKTRIDLHLEFFRPDIVPSRLLAFPTNIHFDWQQWIDERLMDDCVLRTYAIGGRSVLQDSITIDMIEHCRRAGVPLYFNSYLNPPSDRDYVPLEQVRDLVKDGRFAGYVFYETYDFLRFNAEGGCDFIKPEVEAAVKEMAQEPR